MSAITISRGSYTRGREVAQKAADKLGYECISREVILETSKKFNIPEVKLVRAIHDAPSILDRFRYGREKYIAFIQAEILRRMRNDNIIYCGLAGHFFVRDIRHVLQVRILSDFEDRVQNEMEREKITAEAAAAILRRDDEERRKWSQHLYGIDTCDPSLYDLVIHIKKMTVDDAVEIICNTVRMEHFQPTEQSRRAIEDLALAAEVKVALVNLKPNISVEVSNGIALIKTTARESQEEGLIEKMERIASAVPGIQKATMQVRWKIPVD